MAASSNEGRLDRQEQIWAGLYGPPRAKALVTEARAALADDPEADVDRLLAELEPQDDIDTDEAGTMRPT